MLPASWVPTFVRVVPRLPTNANGKVDLDAVRTLMSSTPHSASGTDADEGGSPTERTIRRLLAEVLGEEIELEDDFFDYGGDSLLAGRLVAQVRGDYHVPIRLRDFLDEPNGRTLVRLITAGGTTS
jgi:acyl carrier protein